MLEIEETYECEGERVSIRITQQAPDVWRGEIGTSEPIVFEYFQTPQDAAQYLQGLIRKAFPGCAAPAKGERF